MVGKRNDERFPDGTYSTLKQNGHAFTCLYFVYGHGDGEVLRKYSACECHGEEKLLEHDTQLSLDKGAGVDANFPKHGPFYTSEPIILLQ